MSRRVGLVACSNGLTEKSRPELEALLCTLRGLDLEPVCADALFAVDGVRSAWAEDRARMLMDFYRDDTICEIFDLSGGDLANEVIPFLDFDEIARHDKRLWGYSDLTCVLNAVQARTGKNVVLYQVRNLVKQDGENQKRRFRDALRGGKELFSPECRFLQGDCMQGILAGGNIRCLLKLAGTGCWPDMCGKVLLLEGLGTTYAQAAAYFAQLYQLGAFGDCAGILLGTFTKMDQAGETPEMIRLLRRWIGPDKPLAQTGQIGHGPDSRAAVLGAHVALKQRRDA